MVAAEDDDEEEDEEEEEEEEEEDVEEEVVPVSFEVLDVLDNKNTTRWNRFVSGVVVVWFVYATTFTDDDGEGRDHIVVVT